jgi:2-polyprenyl-3-methyl-5-hydroxy-6-metoxy-1,4-benzoquinol methylase
MAATGQTVDIPTVLNRWEQALNIRFAEEVLTSYPKHEDVRVRLERCPACGFGRFEPALPGNAAFYEAICDLEYYVDNKWEFEQAIRDLQAAGARRILDVGCGSGNFLRLLSRTDPSLRITGQDQNATLMRRLQIEGFEVLFDLPQDFAASNRFEPFDAVCMFQVLEHAAAPVAFLKDYIRLLRPGGLLIITTPDAAGPISNFPNALTELPPHHLTQWTEQAFRAGLPRLGTEVATVRKEPLPDYLWAAYLPVQWESGIWPATVFDPVARRQAQQSLSERVEFAIKLLRSAGTRRLYGVPSHTIYALACRVD